MSLREYTIPGMHIRDHDVAVPLDWASPDSSPRLTLFAREIVAPQRRHEELPCLLYLQGGPGGKSPRPTSPTGWIGEALKTYRVILLDQRGTGRSTPVSGRTMTAFPDPESAASYLRHFRAEAIVADAEHLRKTLFGGRRWTTLGQSYGGFLTLTYLSHAPEGLAACLVTGGLASISPDVSEIYRRTYPRTRAKNETFYQRYPHAAEQISRIADRLSTDPVLLPDGDTLTVRRLQSLGMDFGMKPGFERLHWMIDEALDDDGEPTDTFLAQVWARTAYRDNPLYAALQENIYWSGHLAQAPGWAAQAEHAAHPDFAETARPLLFTGEMVYPWMFAEISGLRPFEQAVNLLAEQREWSALYDPTRLAGNEVPVHAAVYFDDMYVDAELQLETARRVGNLHPWVTNEYEHDGLSTPRVFTHLVTQLNLHGGALRDDD
ncbi:alpha/beta fold hydrolase [Leekyejoonella antrihumi]|uniref:Alpha/beta fold hydrolase n=1 Tax=Leekyejoonella antrihumi TaxID=1660198 RepID=A0A563E5Q8_9MICO|nr:alpha/beta fold hydrolase [Leekyejoonella antrihumi]TWP37856.1 alpha/beta fold hydrolase [Leekyejoonella antrihumi]